MTVYIMYMKSKLHRQKSVSSLFPPYFTDKLSHILSNQDLHLYFNAPNY